MNNIKGLLFDMDGVLFDTERVYLNTWIKVFHEYGYEMSKDVYISVMGTGRENVKKVFLDAFGRDLPIDEMYKEKDEQLLSVVRKGQVPLKLGAKELLSASRKKGYKIALATSAKRERLDIQLKTKNMEEYFDAIICGDDVSKGKPDPEIFLKACYKLGLKPENCIVIEDSPAGIKGAYNGKMTGFHIEDLKKADDEILKYCQKSFKSLLEIKEYLNL
jgi:beta-phosphoglucomutase